MPLLFDVLADDVQRRTAVFLRDCHWPVACSGAVQVRYRYRVYPTPGQQQALARAFGCARVVYNDCSKPG